MSGGFYGVAAKLIRLNAHFMFSYNAYFCVSMEYVIPSVVIMIVPCVAVPSTSKSGDMSDIPPWGSKLCFSG